MAVTQRFGTIGGFVPVADHIDNYVLLAATEVPLVIPSEGVIAVFSFDDDFWVKWTGSGALIPTETATAGGGVELNPTARNLRRIIKAGYVPSLISPRACNGCVLWYKS